MEAQQQQQKQSQQAGQGPVKDERGDNEDLVQPPSLLEGEAEAEGFSTPRRDEDLEVGLTCARWRDMHDRAYIYLLLHPFDEPTG